MQKIHSSSDKQYTRIEGINLNIEKNTRRVYAMLFTKWIINFISEVEISFFGGLYTRDMVVFTIGDRCLKYHRREARCNTS